MKEKVPKEVIYGGLSLLILLAGCVDNQESTKVPTEPIPYPMFIPFDTATPERDTIPVSLDIRAVIPMANVVIKPVRSTPVRIVFDRNKKK